MSDQLDVSPDPQESPRAQPTRRQWLVHGLGLTAAGAGLSPLTGCGGDSAPAPAPSPDQEPAPGPAPEQKASAFTLAVLPDTQFYSRYATEAEGAQFVKNFGSDPYMAQTTWAARNAKALNMPFLIHLGDVVDQVTKPAQWEVADKAMQVLEQAKLPYSMLAGNHDVLLAMDYMDASSQQMATDAQRNAAQEPYLQWFGASRAAKQGTFKGRDPSGWHEYHVFEAEGQKFMVLSLSWRVSDAALAWANQVIAANPELPVILVNHQLLNIDKDGVSPLETPYGLMLWDKLIRKNDQIFMTLNGHHHGAARLTRKNDFGNNVELMVVDYQMAYQGGNGLMRLYEFDLTRNLIRVLSFSPWVPAKPKNMINGYDQAVLTDANNDFVIGIDFKQRFARFAPDFKVAAGTIAGSLVDQARKQLTANFTQPKPRVLHDPKDANDYPVVPDTVAHWRFVGGISGNPVPVGYAVRDEVGGSPLTRSALNVDGVQGAELGDLVWSSDCHRYSAARGSVQFRNTRKMLKRNDPTDPVRYIRDQAPRMSYFTTAADAPANRADLKSGYTVEAFIKIGKDWTNQWNRWMNILTRDGQRWTFDPQVNWEDPQASLLLFAISSLREVQWDGTAYDGMDSKSAWSGEVMTDQWIHVAIVNDPKTFDTVMYIEGSPMLRNVQKKPGLATLGQPWVVGGGAWPNIVKDATGSKLAGFEFQRDDGFLGNIGEIRIVAAALPPEKWLTSRRGG
ncbi:MAG: metallophosphoesterase [Pseudomonadota bacterium]|nr:metallophosphoesterase [Pseudomonadota bacterium]